MKKVVELFLEITTDSLFINQIKIFLDAIGEKSMNGTFIDIICTYVRTVYSFFPLSSLLQHLSPFFFFGSKQSTSEQTNEGKINIRKKKTKKTGRQNKRTLYFHGGRTPKLSSAFSRYVCTIEYVYSVET